MIIKRSSSSFLYIFVAGLVFLLTTFCTEKAAEPENTDPFDELTEEQQRAVTYFTEIALGTEEGNSSKITRKWRSEMKVFVGGDPNQELHSELQSIIDELNQLVSESISITTVSDSTNSNAYVFFGSGEEFANRVSSAEGLVDDNYGLFWFWWSNNNYLVRMASYVDIFRTANITERKHLLREEFTQSLGLAQDSPRFMESIFQISYDGKVTEYAEVDKHIIQLLYHPEMEVGMNSEQARNKAIEIVEEIVPS